MKRSILLFAVLTAFQPLSSQNRLIDRSGTTRFFSEAPLENIEATNNQSLALLDLDSGKVAVSLLIKGFRFDKALMEEHFNENYMESDRFPKATFTGRILDPIDFNKDGSCVVIIKGEMTIHGVTQPVSLNTTFKINGNEIVVTNTFNIRVADYNIKIPKVVINNIAEEVEVKSGFKFNKTK